MTISFTIQAQAAGFLLCAQDKPMQTVGKHPFILPQKTLAAAIAEEWQTQQKYRASAMPLTALAYTAIDQIAGQESAIVEALMIYVDTETLSYFASADALWQRQQELWAPILTWADKQFGITWETTRDVMPLDQPAALHDAVRSYLKKLGPLHLAAACVLASGYSSLLLAIAVLEKHLTAAQAFDLSRLEEDTQAEQWGRVDEVEERAQRLKTELLAAEQFLNMLDDNPIHH